MNSKEMNEWTIIESCWKEGLFATTLKLIQKFIDKYPRKPQAWLILGDCYLNFALFNNARNAFEKSMKLCPTSKKDLPYHYMGLLYREKGNYRTAEKWHKKALGINPKESIYFVFLGSSLVRQEKYYEAKMLYQKAIRYNISPLDEIYLNLGYIYRAEGKYKQAKECLENALNVDLKYEEARIALRDCNNCI